VDARSDIYSLGVTAFFAITGRLPFHGNTDEQVLMLQETQPAPSVTGLRAGVPGRLVEIIDRCLTKNPTDRFGTAEELATALGDTAGAIRGVPGVVDNFLRVAQHTSRRLSILAPLGGVLAYAFFAVSEFGVGHIVLFLFVSWIVGFELLVPPAALLAAARNVLVQGISYDEFCEILKMQAAEIAEAPTVDGRRVMFVSFRRRLLLSAGGVALAVSAVLIALTFRDMSESSRLGLLSLGVSGIILATGTAGWAVFGLMGSRAGGLARHGVWLSPFGRRFFRLAALGLADTPVAERPSIRHPETLLGQAARSALADLGGLEQRVETATVIDKL